MLGSKDHCYFKYARLFEFSGLLAENRTTLIFRLKKEAEELGKKFDETMLDQRPKRVQFGAEEQTKNVHDYLTRKPADYLRKYDYRKLAFELKQSKK
jgi:hypothetical protein